MSPTAHVPSFKGWVMANDPGRPGAVSTWRSPLIGIALVVGVAVVVVAAGLLLAAGAALFLAGQGM